MSNHWRPGEIVVEIGDHTNNYHLFKPLSVKLRGKWSARNYPTTASEKGYGAIPDLPGIMVALDQHKRTLRTVDPIGWPEYKKQLDKSNEITRNQTGAQRECEPTLRKHLSESDIKSTLWAMDEMVRAGSATVINGTLPAPAAIMEMKGQLKVRNTFILEGQTHGATAEEESQVLANATPE